MIVTKETVEHDWPLSGVQIGESLERSPSGRQVGIVLSNEGKFVFRVADREKTKGALEAELGALEFLNNRKFKFAPKLIKTRGGGDYAQIKGRYVHLLEYVEGAHPNETPDTYHRLGIILSELHEVRGCPHKTKFSANSAIKRILDGPPKDIPADPEYFKLLNRQPDYERCSVTMIHTDIGPGNAIQKFDGQMTLIDWDDAGVGPTIFDLGCPLIQQFVSDDLKVKRDIGEAFYRAYFSKRKLPESDIAMIFDAALFFSLIYVAFGDVQKRWRKIQWAVENKRLLESLYKS